MNSLDEEPNTPCCQQSLNGLQIKHQARAVYIASGVNRIACGSKTFRPKHVNLRAYGNAMNVTL